MTDLHPAAAGNDADFADRDISGGDAAGLDVNHAPDGSDAAVALVVIGRRRGTDDGDVVDSSTADLGEWHLTAAR